MKTRTLLVTGTLGLSLLGATVQQALSANGAAKATRTAAAATRAAAMPGGVAAEGRVVTYPGADVVVGTERAGRLVSLRVIEGQRVKKGELLAELESDELRASLAEARARVSESEAEIRLAAPN